MSFLDGAAGVFLGADGTIAGPGSQSPLAGALSIFRYGSPRTGNGIGDDTGAAQSMLNDAARIAQSAGAGWVDCVLPSGYIFNLGQLAVPSGVRVWAYGATVVPIVSEIANGLFFASQDVSRFAIRGGRWLGTGAETAPIFQNGFNFAHNLNDITIADMLIDGWGTFLFTFQNCQRGYFLRNTGINLGNNQNNNYVSFMTALASPQGMSDLLIWGNKIIGTIQGGAVAIVPGFNGANELRAIIAHNILTAGGNSGGVIDLETGLQIGPYSRVIVADNLLTATNGQGIDLKQYFDRVDIHNNDITASNFGVDFFTGTATNVSLTHNRIRATVAPLQGNVADSCPLVQADNDFTGGQRRGIATLVAGTVTVNTTEVASAGERIRLTRTTMGPSPGQLAYSNVTPGASFKINSSNGADTGSVLWEIVH